MAVTYSDKDIVLLLDERKVLPLDRARFQLRSKRGHKERELDVAGSSGTQFRVILRQSGINPLDFTVILAVCPKESNQLFCLRRYNGKHEHTNQIERETFDDFHIDIATERYQEFGAREDAYAKRTDLYSDFHGALDCLIHDCAFVLPPREQYGLFKEV